MTQFFCKIYLFRISASLNIQRKIYTLWGLSRSVTLCSRYLFTDFCSLAVSSLLHDGYSSYKESTETKVMAKRGAKHHGGSLGGSFIIT